jgi:hypothetical protein
MGKIRTGHSTSLDGFIAGPNDGSENPMGEGGERLLAWYSGGDTTRSFTDVRKVLRCSPTLTSTIPATSSRVFGTCNR